MLPLRTETTMKTNKNPEADSIMKSFSTLKKVKYISAALLLLAFILRIIQLSVLFDFETGFFTNHSSPLVFIFYFLTVAGALGLFISEFAAKDINDRFGMKDSDRVRTNRLTGITQIILGALIIFASKPGVSAIIEARKAAGSSVKLISAQLGGTIFLLIPVFGILSSIAIILHAVCALTVNHFEEKIPVISLFPVFWSLFNVIGCFTITASYIKQSELFVEIFAFVFGMIAFLGFGRAVCNIGLSESGKFFIPSAFLSSVFSLMAFTYGCFSGEIKEHLVFFGLFLYFISLVYNFKFKESVKTQN